MITNPILFHETQPLNLASEVGGLWWKAGSFRFDFEKGKKEERIMNFLLSILLDQKKARLFRACTSVWVGEPRVHGDKYHNRTMYVNGLVWCDPKKVRSLWLGFV